GRRQLARPDLLGIVGVVTRRGVDLREFVSGGRDGRPGVVEQDRARGRRALVEREHIAGGHDRDSGGPAEVEGGTSNSRWARSRKRPTSYCWRAPSQPSSWPRSEATRRATEAARSGISWARRVRRTSTSSSRPAS